MTERDDALRQAIDALVEHLTQALVEVDMVAELYGAASAEVGQLHTALQRLVVIEQAKGVVAERAGVDMPAAWERIRGHARAHNRQAADVAAAIVAGTLAV